MQTSFLQFDLTEEAVAMLRGRRVIRREKSRGIVRCVERFQMLCPRTQAIEALPGVYEDSKDSRKSAEMQEL